MPLTASQQDAVHCGRGGRPRGGRIGGSGRAGGIVGVADFLRIGATPVLYAVIAAAINSGSSRQFVLPLAENPWTAVSGMMFLAVALNLCSQADASVAASFYALPMAAPSPLATLFHQAFSVMLRCVVRNQISYHSLHADGGRPTC